MSDDRLRLIPTDPSWLPDDIALRRAVRVLRDLAPDAGSVRGRVHEGVVFVDAGGNAERVQCPACGTDLDPSWWSERVGRAAGQNYERLAVTTPCCGTRTSLNDLDYVWPAGFARAELVVTTPRRGWLTDEERRRVATALGHDVREIRTGG